MAAKTLSQIDDEIEAAVEALGAQRKRVSELRRERAALATETVDDYELLGSDGAPVRLSQLFGDHDDLIVVHNMGRGCPYCTLWADGFVGLAKHLERRAGFVISSPDAPAEQREFAAERGWPFTMVSVRESTFAADMGFRQGDDYWPGYSAFRRRSDGTIERVGRDFFGPGDDYCPVWHFYDSLADGSNGWQPVI